MQISSVNYYEKISILQQNKPVHAEPLTVNKSQASEDLFTLSPMAKNKMEDARQIMSRYDIKHMSFNGLGEMSSELREADLMTDQEWLMMNTPRDHNPSIQGMFTTDMNKPVDIISTFESELDAKKRLGQDRKLLTIGENRLSLLRFLDSLSSS
ncbi:hypothetical protein HR060_16785 [Catenovulum sp. SM1970]|uniref:hypothetical protein n=1 Tax=Marinifaba aquimaris TaxID=2741323 RepID=UPI00157333AD|nr:hypothetical protein [Marinifaba aquimaris]NTS78501.1 hypothetical protein [Marinifaba aquimaris]